MGTCVTDLVLLCQLGKVRPESLVWVYLMKSTACEGLFSVGLVVCEGCGMVWIQDCSHCLASEGSFVPSHPPPLLTLAVLWCLMSLSLCLDSDRHCVTSCLQTHRLWDNITARRRRREGGETDVRTELVEGDGEHAYINHRLTAAEPLCSIHSYFNADIPHASLLSLEMLPNTVRKRPEDAGKVGWKLLTVFGD